MGDIENYWLPRSSLASNSVESRDFEAAKSQIESVIGSWVEPPPGMPIWAFLNRLVDVSEVLLHGSADPAIEVFEPRSPIDYSPDDFSKQCAVFAASDGIWPIFYAVINRPQPGLRFLNSALQFISTDGSQSEMHYFFSVSHEDKSTPLWRNGTVYILPRPGFIRQKPEQLGRHLVEEPHWASPDPVLPLAKIAVSPEDFPFLGKVREHNVGHIDAKACKDPTGFPWL